MPPSKNPYKFQTAAEYCRSRNWGPGTIIVGVFSRISVWYKILEIDEKYVRVKKIKEQVVGCLPEVFAYERSILLSFLYTKENWFDEEGAVTVITPPHKQRICSECQRPMILREGLRGPFYGCSGYPRCQNTSSLEESEMNPAVRIANLRNRVEKEFQLLWYSGEMSKIEALAWMGRQLGKNRRDAHVRKLNEDECRKFLEILQKRKQS